ncbi:hypothetical protein GGR57DRAFT_498932 [Xylariaceae sp. FL1272]|nr:hypothetical protein GGR57DRAFT_498932 [Xylariaceae sp. FL1272]
MGPSDGGSTARATGRHIDLSDPEFDPDETLSCSSFDTTSTGPPPPGGLQGYIYRQRDLLSDQEKNRIVENNLQAIYEDQWKFDYFRKLSKENEQKPVQSEERDITDLTKHPPGAKPFWVQKDGAVILGIKGVTLSGFIPPCRSACIRSTDYDEPRPRPGRQAVESQPEPTKNAEQTMDPMDFMELDPTFPGAIKRRMTESLCDEEMETPAKRYKSQE